MSNIQYAVVSGKRYAVIQGGPKNLPMSIDVETPGGGWREVWNNTKPLSAQMGAVVQRAWLGLDGSPATGKR